MPTVRPHRSGRSPQRAQAAQTIAIQNPSADPQATRRHIAWLAGLTAAAAWVAAMGPGADALGQTASPYLAQQVATGLSSPLFATHAPGEPGTLYVVEKGGVVKTLDLATQTVASTPFLDISGSISTNSERGLIGLAFDPDYATNQQVYLNYTNTAGDTVIERRTASGGILDPSSATPILSIPQPQSNHNGGWIGFKPQATGAARHNLYIAVGDGGGGNDDGTGHTAGIGNAQDTTNNLLGKLLRIDVAGDDFAADASRNYAIPSSNPFVGTAGDDEIYAYGLRNPWRNGFDRQTGDLYIADVGQGEREEIDLILNPDAPGATGGQNFGWRVREGDIQTPGVGGPDSPDFTDPLYDYDRTFDGFGGQSVTGGYLYRGPVEDLQGLYIFGDFVSNQIWALDPDDPDNTVMNLTNLLETDGGQISGIASFAEDAAGHLYVLSINNGQIHRIVPEPATALLTSLGGLAVLTRRRRR